MMIGKFETKHLPMEHDGIAPDGSYVRILLRLKAGGMAHFELGPNQISKAVTHRTVEEIWFFLSGRGKMWRQQNGESEIVDVYPGVCLTIPLGTHFQFRSFGYEPLCAIGVTMPPWPGEGEAIVVDGKWKPTRADEISVSSPSKDSERVERTRDFVQALLVRYASYHQHKEAMAYAGITVFGGIAGAAAVSSAWPPAWGQYTAVLAIVASTLLWGAILTFLRFQLTRRRWAALRVAGCDRLLAAWLQEPPSDEALALLPSKPRPRLSFFDKMANYLWGSKTAVRAVDTKESVYPSALVKEWLAQEERGTDALRHERLVLLSGWAFYIILIVSALLR